ncbi:MAG: hypothetical protein MRERC_1c054 [Mycoplasmataceae bacterium RC_NB112A]|nr:MAG: hypothetical protein MRERC_1c054 [Mycoplasmataceae bacterium RC_NB112A]
MVRERIQWNPKKDFIKNPLWIFTTLTTAKV